MINYEGLFFEGEDLEKILSLEDLENAENKTLYCI